MSAILLLGWLAGVYLVLVNYAEASSLNIEVQNSRIDIDAKQVPLIDLLKTISEKTEIIIESRDPLTELVSLNLKGASIEQCLRRLLGNRNYALTYKKTEDSQIIPASMHILGTGSVTLIKPEASPSPPEDPLKRVERKSFEQAFGDKNKLAKQISAQPVMNGSDEWGIIITGVSSNSIFRTIGLSDGDIVRDVNGVRVDTAKEFIEALRVATQEQTMIRIERLKNNHEMDPIYIRLQ